MNEELSEQLKSERAAKQKEAELREAAQRTLRQMNAKTRVSTSHQESVEKLLKDREEEIKKLRQMLNDARQRTTSSLTIPRLTSPASEKPTRHAARAASDNQNEDTPKTPSRPGSASLRKPAPPLSARSRSSLRSSTESAASTASVSSSGIASAKRQKNSEVGGDDSKSSAKPRMPASSSSRGWR